jgi:hypothetical protein
VANISGWPPYPKNALMNLTLLLQPPTMPPIRSHSSRESIEREGRVLLAI